MWWNKFIHMSQWYIKGNLAAEIGNWSSSAMALSWNVKEIHMALSLTEYALVPVPESPGTALCISALQGMIQELFHGLKLKYCFLPEKYMMDKCNILNRSYIHICWVHAQLLNVLQMPVSAETKRQIDVCKY